jgi:hypothetical protein
MTMYLDRMNTLLRLLLVLLVLTPVTAMAQGRLLPVDQAATVPDFFSFRAQLQIAVARRDVAAVASVLSKDATLSFGGDSGVEDFSRMWTPSAPESRLWEVLAGVLALGGTFGPDGTFTAPYIFSRWPQHTEAYTHMAAIGTGVRVRSAPSTGAQVIEALDYSIVEIVDTPDSESKWVQIKLAAGRTGFVDRRFLRSPVDYRVNFAKLDGRWQLVFFLAGD